MSLDRMVMREAAVSASRGVLFEGCRVGDEVAEAGAGAGAGAGAAGMSVYGVRHCVEGGEDVGRAGR